MFADYPSDRTGSGVHGGLEVADTKTYSDAGNYLGDPNWSIRSGRIGYDPRTEMSTVTSAEAQRLQQEAQRIKDFGSGNRFYNQALDRQVGLEYAHDPSKRHGYINEIINIGRRLAGEGKIDPLSATVNDIMRAYSAEQTGVKGARNTEYQGGYLANLLDTYGGYAGLQKLSETNPDALDKIVKDAGNLGITLNNIPGVYERGREFDVRHMGTAPPGYVGSRLNPFGDKFDPKEAARAHFENPMAYMPMQLQALVAAGNAFGGVIGSYTDPRTGIGYHVGRDGVPYPANIEFRNPQPNEPGGAAPLIDQVSPVTAPQGAPAFDRSTALDQLIESTIGGTVNPGIEDEYFNRIIKEGILGRNFDLGADATQQQFEGTFGSSRLGQELLGEESGRLRDVSRGQIGDVFTGKAFEPITDDAAINNILAEKRSSAFGDISRFGARGNLSTTGGATAGEFISSREPQARTRLEEIGAGVRESGQRGIDVIRDRALQQAGTFNLGDPFFDIAPFTAERETAIQGRLPSIGPDIRSQLGAERLFDTQAAIREGAESQGLVSGAPSFLDELASRSGQRSQRNRGIGSIGSGVF